MPDWRRRNESPPDNIEVFFLGVRTRQCSLSLFFLVLAYSFAPVLMRTNIKNKLSNSSSRSQVIYLPLVKMPKLVSGWLVGGGGGGGRGDNRIGG